MLRLLYELIIYYIDMSTAYISNIDLHMDIPEHYCEDGNFPLNKFFQEI